MLIDIIRTKLSTNETILPTVNQLLATALQEHWGSSGVWHVINWDKDITGIISRAAASVFVGPEKAADPEWQTLVQTYVCEFFTAVGELHAWPAAPRPVVHWFLPRMSTCRAGLTSSAVMRDVVHKREQEAKAGRERGLEAPQYNDAVAWTQNVPSNNLPAGDIQLALTMAALFTTTEALKQVLIDIAQHPELVVTPRQEIKQSLSDQGLGLAALGKMELLDSVMKESQRQVPVSDKSGELYHG
ncbi:hypothetical protein HFD88_008055 [Aspergillus terreus]|nr:hypothetical protein HFD88_008055 [Aspergillus terreus]